MGKPGQSCVWLPALELIGRWGERGEVKHLSTRRKRYSVSSGERKRRRLNCVRVIPGRGCVRGVVGPVVIMLPRGGQVRKLWCSRRVWEGLA